MSRFLIYKCDRCGREERLDPSEDTSYWKQETRAMDGRPPRDAVHICEPCTIRYWDWFYDPKAREETEVHCEGNKEDSE